MDNESRTINGVEVTPELTAIQYLETQITRLERELSSAKVRATVAENDAKRLKDGIEKRRQARAARKYFGYGLLPPKDVEGVICLLEWLASRMAQKTRVAEDTGTAIEVLKRANGGGE